VQPTSSAQPGAPAGPSLASQSTPRPWAVSVCESVIDPPSEVACTPTGETLTADPLTMAEYALTNVPEATVAADVLAAAAATGAAAAAGTAIASRARLRQARVTALQAGLRLHMTASPSTVARGRPGWRALPLIRSRAGRVMPEAPEMTRNR
jgi:hypothetical protein